MPTPTLSLYVRHEQIWRGRGRVAERIIKEEWAAKSAEEKAEIVHLIGRAHERQGVAIWQADRYTNFKATSDGQPYNDNNTFPYRDAALNALGAATSSQNAHSKECRAWRHLRAELVHQNADPQSVASTATLETAARGRSDQAGVYVTQLEHRLDHVPLPEYPPGSGLRRMKESWLSERAKMASLRAKADAEIAPDAEGVGMTDTNPAQWFAVADFSGGMSTASLWVRVDDQDDIQDRVVRKEEFFGSYWYDARGWEGDVRDLSNRVPRVLACTRAMNTVEGLRTVVKLRQTDAKVNKALKKQVLYLEFAPHGDLNTLIDSYMQPNDRIPEPMIWHVAESLAECLVAMARGNIDPDMRVAKDWVPVVHRDLKPRNVFLGRPDPERYPLYPRPIVGDFGLAIRTSADDEKNPDWWQGAGTPGFLAPEINTFVDRDSLEPMDVHPILSHTDVYCFGLILLSLVRRQPPTQPVWLGDPNATGLPHFTDEEKDNLGYTDELYDLIEQCLWFDPNQRRKPDQVLQYVQQLTRNMGAGADEDGDTARFHRGMIDQDSFGDPDAPNHAIRFQQDQCMLGMSRDDIP